MSSIDDWIKMMWYIHRIQYYSAVRKDEILPFATMWMDLDNITLSDMSEKTKNPHMVSHIWFCSYVRYTSKTDTHRHR